MFCFAVFFFQMKKIFWKISADDSVQRNWPRSWVQVSKQATYKILRVDFYLNANRLYDDIFTQVGPVKVRCSTFCRVTSKYREMTMKIHCFATLVKFVQVFIVFDEFKKSHCRQKIHIYGIILYHKSRKYNKLSSRFYSSKCVLFERVTHTYRIQMRCVRSAYWQHSKLLWLLLFASSTILLPHKKQTIQQWIHNFVCIVPKWRDLSKAKNHSRWFHKSHYAYFGIRYTFYDYFTNKPLDVTTQNLISLH